MNLSEALELMRQAEAECAPFWDADRFGVVPSEFAVLSRDGLDFTVRYLTGINDEISEETLCSLGDWMVSEDHPQNLAARLQSGVLPAYSKLERALSAAYPDRVTQAGTPIPG